MSSKRFLALALALMMVLSCVPVSARAEETQPSYVAQIGDTGYENLADALNAGTKGDTVTLLQDVKTDGGVFLVNEITLDLNGKTLEAKHLSAFQGSYITDSSNGTGLLKVARGYMALQKNNPAMPIWNGTGYIFTVHTRFQERKTETPETGSAKYIFLPQLNPVVHDALEAGLDSSDVELKVEISWTRTDGKKAAQTFAYGDDLVKTVLDSYDAETGRYGMAYTLLLKGVPQGMTLSYRVLFVSASGVEFHATEDNAFAGKPEGGQTGSSNVTTDKNNKVTEDVTVSAGEQASAVVPEGTQLNANTSTVKLTVEEVKDSQSDIILNENEEQKSVDVHIEGVAADNTVPMMITLKEFADKGLNEGNLKLYHIENGETIEMVRVASVEDFTAHNQFWYDPVTGDVVLYMASFSEVTAVSDTTKAWNGNIATGFAGGTGTEKDPYIIANADQLAYFAKVVGGMGYERKDFEGEYVKLIADINLADDEENNVADKIFYPIGYYYNAAETFDDGSTGPYSTVWSFKGTFDGNGNTISNFYQNTWEIAGDYDAGYYKDGMGLFGYVVNGTVKNLTVDNFSSDGEFTPTGVIAAYAVNSTFENIAITNCNPRVYNTGNGGIIGIAGNSGDDSTKKITLKNITVDQTNMISALWGSYDVACGGLMGMFRGNGLVELTNCHVAAIMDVNNDVCANYQYYWYRYAGMIIGSVRKNTTSGGYTIPDLTGITATNCTVTYGDWNQYWYCELVANSLASYTHDHQFSRLTEIANVSEIQDADGNWNREGNFVIPAADNSSATCYHIFKNADGTLYQHFHDVFDESNPNIYEEKDINGNGQLDDLKEDRQRYFMPFNQLFQGDGYGVKAVYTAEEYTGYARNLDIKIVEGGTVKSTEKFAVKDDAVTEYNHTAEGDGAAIEIVVGNLFKAIVDQSKLSTGSVQVFVSPVGENSTVSGTYSANIPDWDKGTLSLTGTGSAKITITDYFYCTPTVMNITVGEATAVDKFTAKAVDPVTLNATMKLGDLFTAVAGAEIDSASVKVSGDGVEFTPDTTDWTQGTVKFTKTGSIRVEITDNNLCVPTTITVNVKEPDPVEKFESKIDRGYDFLYRVGNLDTFPIGVLFKAVEGVEIDTAKVEVTVTSETEGITGTYTANTSDWTKGTLKINGAGLVTITITDNNLCTPTSVTVEVVAAKNAYTGTVPDATGTNVVLLEDVSDNGFTVSGTGCYFYGNGFTVTCAGNGAYGNVEKNSKSLNVGYVTVQKGGTLDNVKIICNTFPESYMFTSELEAVDGTYPYSRPAVTVSEDSTISGCYIYGARVNILVRGGNVTIKDTITDSGALANIHIDSMSGYTVTLDDVTTIQKLKTADFDASKKVLGFAVAVGTTDSTSNPTIKLVGDLRQYNWVTQTDADNATGSYSPGIISGALAVEKYQHTINGNTAVNLGIAFVMKDLPINIVDERSNKTDIPYELNEVTMKIMGNNLTGKVYSIVNSETAAARYDADEDNVVGGKKFINATYIPQYAIAANLGGQLDTDETDDTYCKLEDGIVKVMFPSGEMKELDLAAMVSITKYTGQTLEKVISCVDENGNPVTVTDGKITLTAASEYTVTYTVEDSVVYDQNGNDGGSQNCSWELPLSVTLKDKSIPDAYFGEFDTSKQLCYADPTNWLGNGDYVQFVPFLAGLKIYDYIGQNAYPRFDGDTDLSKIAKITLVDNDTSSQGDKEDHIVTVELTDGGKLVVYMNVRANTGGKTYTGSFKVKDNVLYFVNGGTTSATGETWTIHSYEFTGNNGVVIESGPHTFIYSDGITVAPSDSFNTTINYTVTYDANGGNCGQTTGYATSASAAVTLPTPTRSGYMFVGWYTAAEGGENVDEDGDGKYTPSADITLYAQWGKPSTVTYNANGGSCDKESDKYTGTALTLPTPTRDGYWFVGWYDAAEGGNKVGGAGEKYQATGDITLYAQWSPVYTVTYNANGGSVDPTSAKYEGTALTLPMPTREGYAFNGWYTAAEGGERKGGAGDAYTPEANITLYAQWKDPVVVTYDATTNGGSCSTTSQTFTGEALTLPTPADRTGYTFNGWYTAATGGTNVDEDKDGKYTPTANITLYAQWTINSYTIKVETSNATVKVNGTEVSDSGTVSIQYGAQVTVEVTYSETESQSTTIEGTDGTTYTSPFNMPAQIVTINATSSGGCVTGDTLVTLADGTQKRMDMVSYEDELLVWNFFNGEYDVVPAALIVNHGDGDNTVIELFFEDGTVVKAVNAHAFFDADTNEMVLFSGENAKNYIGHNFIKMDGDGYSTVKLVNCEVYEDYTSCYSIVSATHYNFITEGMLSLTNSVYGMLAGLEVGDNMKYDEETLKADIDRYGLYTYEDFAEYITEEVYQMFNGAYLKISVEKGYITFEEIVELIDRFL